MAAPARSQTSKLADINPRQAYENMQSSFEKNPEMLESIYWWLVIGFILLTLGTVLLLFSEINAVLVCRDQDFRNRLIKGQHVEVIESREYQLLLERERLITAPRPYLSTLAVTLMMISFSCLLFPLCDLLRLMGLPSAPCILLITFGALFGAITTSCLWMFLIWSCTRIWAASIYLLIGLTGSIMLPGGNPILVMAWISLAFGVYYCYFMYLPTLYPPEDQPFWLQSVGEYSVDPTIENFQKALDQAGTVLSLEAKEAVDGVRKASERAVSSVQPKPDKPPASAVV